MGFRNCCCAILKKNPHVDYVPVQEMDWFELTLGKTPPVKNSLSELYMRLVSPGSDESVKKIVKFMGNASHEKALRALATPFMQVVDTVKEDVANKVKGRLPPGADMEVKTVEENKEFLLELVANPKLRTMREVVEKFTPNWKRLLLKLRYDITSGNLKEEVERRFPLSEKGEEMQNLEKILSFFNRITEFVVYLHENCTYRSALKSTWHQEQLKEINEAAAYYRGLYITRHHTLIQLSTPLQSMKKQPKGFEVIARTAPMLQRLGLLHPCAKTDYWPACLNIDHLSEWNRSISRTFLSKHEQDLRPLLYLVNSWIFSIVYCHSLTLRPVPARTSRLLCKLRCVLQDWGSWITSASTQAKSTPCHECRQRTNCAFQKYIADEVFGLKCPPLLKEIHRNAKKYFGGVLPRQMAEDEPAISRELEELD